MPTQDTFEKRREDFIKELKELGKKYDIALVGTCYSESIYGEITVIDMFNPLNCNWLRVLDNIWNINDGSSGWDYQNKKC